MKSGINRTLKHCQKINIYALKMYRKSSISLCHWLKWMFSPWVCHCVTMAVLPVTVFTQIAQISPAFHFATGLNGCFHPECVTVSWWQYWLSLFSHRLHRSVQHFTLPLVEMDAFHPSVSLCHHGSIGCHCFHTDCTDLSSISLCHWLKWMFSPRVCHCVTMAVLAVTVFTQIAQISPAFHFATGWNWCFHPECVTVSPWQYWLSLFSHRLHRSVQHFTLPLVEMDVFTWVCHCVMMAVLAVTVFTQIAQISPAFHFATGWNGCFHLSVSLCHHGSIGCHCFHTDCTDLSSISLCHWLKWMLSPRVCHCVTMAVLAVTVFTQIAQICPAVVVPQLWYTV